MPSLIHCIYASTAVRPFAPDELVDLLKRARTENESLGVTGMLLHADGNFFQIIEGAPEAVDALYEKIGGDRRHDQVTLIIREAIAQRHFGAWTMGFSKISRGELATITGVNDFFGQARCLGDVGAGRAKKLLAAFREGRWRARLSGATHEAHA